MATTTIAMRTKTGSPRTSARAQSVNPSGSPASGTWSDPRSVVDPRKMLSVPSVATIDGTWRTVTMKPLTIPSRRPMGAPARTRPTGSST